jgi:transcriptional regulator with XRE-family HTH domain
MPESPDPLVAWRRLRIELRRLREHKGDTQQQVADAMDWSLSKLIRIETGRIRISTNDLRVLTSYYGVEGDARDELIELSRDSRRQAWWEPFREYISPEYATFVACETDASEIRNFEPNVVPGLLQVPAYVAAVMGNAPQDPVVAEKMTELRLRRQQLLERHDMPKLRFIIDESVVRRVAGGRDVMREQLRHLRTMAGHPDVTLLVAPFAIGLYRLHRRGYVVFRFADESPMILYLAGGEGEMLTSDVRDERPVTYLEAFDELAGKLSLKIVDDALQQLG